MSLPKNQYSISFWNEEGKRVLFLEYVHQIENALSWANEKGIVWTRANVYYRKSRELVEQIKKEK